MSQEGMEPSLAVEGPTTREVFEAYLERVLGPALTKGQVVVMDNLSSHKGSRVRELIEGRGSASLYTCRPTHQISIRSKKPSQRSRDSLEKPRPVAVMRWWRLWVGRSQRSQPETLRASLSTVATFYWLSNYDKRYTSSRESALRSERGNSLGLGGSY